MKRAVWVLVVSAFVLPQVSMADDKKRGEHRGRGGEPKVEIHDNGKNYKYEYKDGRCKYEYRYNYRTGEEKTEKKGDCRGVSPRRAVYRTYDEPRYERDDRYYEQDEPAHREDDRNHDRPSRLSCNREMIGRVLGGVVGGIAGSQIGSGSGRDVATVAGAVIGVLVGGNIGKKMDRADSACAYQAFEFANDGEAVFWNNADANVEYSVTPLRRVRDTSGRQCREFEALAVGAGSKQSNRGVACRASDGSWSVQSK